MPTEEIIHTVYNLSTGRIRSYGRGLPVLESGEAYIEGAYDGRKYWIGPDMTVLERIEPAYPVMTGNVLTFGPMPSDTQVKVYLEEDYSDSVDFTMAQITTDGGITFEDPGKYRIQVSPPFPWNKPEEYEYEVS